MSRKRDYKAEYRRRIERGLKRGLSRSQARGHPKANEAAVSSHRKTPVADAKLFAALKLLHNGQSQKAAAQAVGVSADRLRRFTSGYQLAHWDGRKWVMTDNFPRQVKVATKGQYKVVTAADFDEASKAGSFSNAIKAFLDSNEVEHLLPFIGEGVIDVNRKFRPFETEPNELYRLAELDTPAFHEVYRIMAPD